MCMINGKVKNIVIYNNHIDIRIVQYLVDYLNCPVIAENIPYDFFTVKNVYGVVAGEFTFYVKQYMGKEKDR
ncbi:hypothetical protein CLOACE_08860 [Clostridium acetireducens DSM 10703]|uniref:Uncharacterized protein n=1 Tax=Clostridium acetireducens DSM 10703 TaxID=1121290 RepID=A0A1E8F0Q5_9CLOT|nr:hypothetical protein [Clostridium acetireducens]OFI06731.1 hypothetical protein CLOACE_08860 [Clostridium acetireducens DSM 10703]